MWDNIVQAPEKTRPGIEPLPRDQQSKEILSVARGGGIAFVGAFTTRALSYIYSLVLIRSLGAESFGLYTLALAIITLVGLIADLGLVQGVVRYGAIQSHAKGRAGTHKVTIVALQIVVPASLLFMFTLFFGANYLAILFSKPDLGPLIKSMGISIPFMSIQALLLASTRSLKIIKYSVIVWVVQPLCALLLAMLFIFCKLGILGVSFAYSISTILGACLASYFYLRLMINARKSDEKFSLSQMVKFSLPVSINSWVDFANQRSEIYFLGFLSSAIDVGIYNISWRLAGLETILIESLNQLFGPFTSELSYQHKIKKLGELYKTQAKWGFSFALVLFLIYILFGADIMSIFDATFVRGTTVLIMIGLAQLINAITGPCGTVLLMSGHSGLSLLNTIILLVSSILLDWILILNHGLTGAAWAGLLTIVLVNILRVAEVWIILKIHPFRWDLIKPLIAGISSFGAVYILRAFFPTDSLLIDLLWIILFILFYIIILIFLKINQEDKMVITAIQQKIFGSKKKPDIVY